MNGIDIISGVCARLHEKWPNIKIYRERAFQDFEEPCFFVWESRVRTEPVIYPRFDQRHTVEIRYYAGEEYAENAECATMSFDVIEALNAIILTSDSGSELPVWAIDFSSNRIDEAIATTIEYKVCGYFGTAQGVVMNEMTSDLAFK